MYSKLFYSIVLVLPFFSLSGSSLSPVNNSHSLLYFRSSFVEPSTWDEVTPYLLPAGHPLWPLLDAIFFEKRVIANEKSLVKAKFRVKDRRDNSRPIIASPRYVNKFKLKIFTDDQPLENEWILWINRIQGSLRIQEVINRHGYNDLFKTPKKWIYPLPSDPPAAPNSHRKNFILVVENMNLLDHEDNKIRWRSKAMTPKILDALYIVLNEAGLIDSIYIDNVSFSTDGRLAFVDTEHFDKWPICYEKLLYRLSPSMRIYWQNLINQGGPARH